MVNWFIINITSIFKISSVFFSSTWATEWNSVSKKKKEKKIGRKEEKGKDKREGGKRERGQEEGGGKGKGGENVGYRVSHT